MGNVRNRNSPTRSHFNRGQLAEPKSALAGESATFLPRTNKRFDGRCRRHRSEILGTALLTRRRFRTGLADKHKSPAVVTAPSKAECVWYTRLSHAYRLKQILGPISTTAQLTAHG